MYYGENDCAWCGKNFKTKEEHDSHYVKCSDDTPEEITKEQAFEIINNPNNY